MFRIVDGRDCFYQWDLDRQITVEDPTITEVHFCNRTDDCSLVVEVVRGIAAVPNAILQRSFDVRVFAYDGKATRYDEVFKVKPRTKPSDYVYTEVEIKRYDDLNKRIDEIEQNGISDEVINNAVNNYLDENPIDLTGYATESYVNEKINAIPEPDLTGYATKKYVDDAIANIDIPEGGGGGSGGGVDLSNYYTKEETDLAIYNSKDTYYIDFSATPNGAENAIAATAEMIEFAERYNSNKNVCIYIKNTHSTITGWTSAIIGGKANNISLRTADIDSVSIKNEYAAKYYTYYLKLTDGVWMQYRELIGEFTLTTKEYVDEAIANIEIPESGGVEIYRLVKPSSEPTKDPMDGDMVQITDAHSIEYLNRAFAGEVVLAYTWKIGLKNYLIAEVSKASGRLTLHAHSLWATNIENYTFYIDLKDDGNWYWVGYRFEALDIEEVTQEAVQTALNNIGVAEGGAY